MVLYLKVTVLKAKILTDLIHNVRKLSGSKRVLFIVIPVDKAIVFFGVPVEIAEEGEFASVAHCFYEAFGVSDGWVEHLWRVPPFTVEVAADYWAAVVAVDYAVGVQHWDDLEGEFVTEEDCLLGFGEEEVYEALDF